MLHFLFLTNSSGPLLHLFIWILPPWGIYHETMVGEFSGDRQTNIFHVFSLYLSEDLHHWCYIRLFKGMFNSKCTRFCVFSIVGFVTSYITTNSWGMFIVIYTTNIVSKTLHQTSKSLLINYKHFNDVICQLFCLS